MLNDIHEEIVPCPLGESAWEFFLKGQSTRTGMALRWSKMLSLLRACFL